MKTAHGECDTCISKKRKCGKELPKCQNCVSIGHACHYHKGASASLPGGHNMKTSKALEDRLKKLESIVQSLHLDETSNSDDGHYATSSPPSISGQPHGKLQQMPPMVVPASPSPSIASFPSHVDALRPDLEDLFFSTGSSYLFLQESHTRKAIQESFFMRFAVYTLAASVAPPKMVHAEFGSRQEMAEAYFKRAESFLRRVFRKPSYHGVIGLFGLILYCTRTNRGPEAFYYYTVGVRIALSLGLNSESSYTRAGLSEEHKDIMRATWWTVYMADRMLSALRFEPPLIKDVDCGVRLPISASNMNHPQDHIDKLQIAIMSSTEWYVPTPRNLSTEAYLLLLVKIHGRIIAFSQDTKSERIAMTQAEFLFRESALSAALRDWYAAIPDNVRNVLVDIKGDTSPPDPKATWGHAYIMILYYCIKLYLPKQSLLANIQENALLAASCSAAREVFLAGCDLAAILQCFLKLNPEFKHVPPFVASCIFGAGLMVLIVSRMNLNPNDVAMAEVALSTFSACLNQHATLFNIGNPQKALLDRLATCRDPLLLVIAIKSLKNMKGDTVSSLSTDMLVASDEPDEDDNFPVDPQRFNNPLQIPQVSTNLLGSFSDSALLESVAQMANPYASLLIGGGTVVQDDFSNIFDFNMGQ
ncbi:hypothetical protein HDV03_003895 [Kappamyces sp. JEL0829]|nr:hypothetical protein HDV03_003895 [Kappamyces sp. JEL0829]